MALLGASSNRMRYAGHSRLISRIYKKSDCVNICIYKKFLGSVILWAASCDRQCGRDGPEIEARRAGDARHVRLGSGRSAM